MSAYLLIFTFITYQICQLNKSMSESNAAYENENKELYQMHKQRLQRSQLTATSSNAESIISTEHIRLIDEESKYRQIKDKIQEKHNFGTKIWLNNLFYDKRNPAQKTNSFSMPALFQQDPTAFMVHTIKSQVESVLITTYGFEIDVFLPLIKEGIPLFVYNRMEDLAQGKIQRNYASFNNFTVLSPPKKNKYQGVFHPKLWIIKFKQFIRVVVCTANNHVFDWSVWQNAFWFEDFKQKTTNQQQKDDKFNFGKDFEQTLTEVLMEMQPKDFNIFDEMKLKLSKYDFRGVKAVLIPSFAGAYKGEEINKYGQAKVKRVMEAIGPKYETPVLTCNSSSLGVLDEKFIDEMTTSFCPAHPQPIQFKLIYPTFQYVREKTCGEAGVLFFSQKKYKACSKHLFHLYHPAKINGVAGGIPHFKTIIVEEATQSQICTLYVGSHNMTQSAWGSFQKNSTQIKCANFQLGVLFPRYSKQQLLRWIPYEYPPRKYSAEDKPFLHN